MAYNQGRNVELYLLKAQNFSEESAPNQKRYYFEAAQWLKENQFNTAEDAVAAMRQTKYYEGAGLAQTADDIELRIHAMEKVGYEDVAKIHRERRDKFAQRGNEYAFSQEWIDDYNRAYEASEKYARRKEVFGKIFNGYLRIAGNPQSEHRKEAANGISQGLAELEELGVSFDELASDKVYQNLTMTTKKGMDNFVAFVHNIISNAQIYDDSMADIKDEQETLAKFVREHKSELIAAGKKETWHRANCIAVPSNDPSGYDFIALKEVDD